MMKMTKLLASTAVVAALMLSTSFSGTSFAAGMARDGTFRVTAYINGRAVPAIIDTGATFLSMSARMANSLGIQYTAGRPGVNPGDPAPHHHRSNRRRCWG